MSEKTLLSKVEIALANVWGGDVKVSLWDSIEDHPHVARLVVQMASDSAPQTVMLKRWRIEGEERFSPEFSARHLANEWASIRFLASILGDASPTPQIYAGDQAEGFLVMEDLGDVQPLKEALWGDDPAKAAQVMVRYGEILGLLHGKSATHFDAYAQFQQQLNRDYSPQTTNYFDIFQETVQTLERLGVEFPAAALDDLHEAAGTLAQPGSFNAFIHGDPVHSNLIEQQGRWRLIDFEAGIFRHALVEGAYPRMIFPTTGLRDVLRIPDSVWRQSEAAYRAVLIQHLSDAGDDGLYGSGLTAACAFWTLVFCHAWLERAISGDDPVEIANHIRGCAITRFELFVSTSREFQCLTRLGDVFEGLVTKLRDQWPEDACTLPFYPAFRSAEFG